MKRFLLKMVSTLSTAAVITSSASLLSVPSASAESAPVLSLSADGDYYVPVSYVNSGDYTLRIKVYIENAGDQKFETAQIEFNSDSDVRVENNADGTLPAVRTERKNIIFRNISDPKDTAEKTTKYYKGSQFPDGIEYTTSYKDIFCFGQFSKRSSGYVYTPGTGATTNRYAEPKGYNIGTHSNMKYDGNGGVYFTITQTDSTGSQNTVTYSTSNFVDDGELEIGEIEMYELPVGGVRLRYKYIDQKTFEEKIYELEYDNFDKNSAKDTVLMGYNDKWIWTSTNASKRLGDDDEFSLCEVDAVIQKGTAVGDYTISLGGDTHIKSSSQDYSLSRGNLSTTKATIHIVDDIKVTDYSINKKLYYYSGSNDVITSKDVVNYVKADVYVNGSVQNVDISSGVELSVDGSSSEVSVSDFVVSGDDKYRFNSYPLVYSGYNLVDPDSEDILTSTVYIGLRGDANLDGAIDSKDAVMILQYYAKKIISSSATISDDPALEDFIYFLADVDGASKDHGASGSAVDSKDAVKVLKYFAQSIVGTPSWDNV